MDDKTTVRKGSLTSGCIAVIECYQEIPCDVCELVCHKAAIKVGSPLTKVPIFDSKKCSGCGLCVVACPGLAIFLVDPNFSENEAIITFPYEYLPLPKVGSIVNVVNRLGMVVGKGRVLEVRDAKKFDATRLISVAVSKQLAQEVRGIVRPKGDLNSEE
ncbi:MAG: 4Fe-4S binding protein [Candidatus Heimdallarchaeota archaeon]